SWKYKTAPQTKKTIKIPNGTILHVSSVGREPSNCVAVRTLVTRNVKAKTTIRAKIRIVTNPVTNSRKMKSASRRAAEVEAWGGQNGIWKFMVLCGAS